MGARSGGGLLKGEFQRKGKEEDSEKGKENTAATTTTKIGASLNLFCHQLVLGSDGCPFFSCGIYG